MRNTIVQFDSATIVTAAPFKDLVKVLADGEEVDCWSVRGRSADVWEVRILRRPKAGSDGRGRARASARDWPRDRKRIMQIARAMYEAAKASKSGEGYLRLLTKAMGANPTAWFRRAA